MKRHKSLYPFSHDHHHALVRAKNLRIASASSDASSLHQAIVDLIAFWDTELQTHFRQEEEILLPTFAQYSSTNHPEIIETLRQHAEIQHAVAQLRKCIELDDALTIESRVLADLLSTHIRYEEQTLFPTVQAMVPEEALWDIHRRLIAK
jgi:iron-sulfur cluster repair protein YtfE (RIC family)